ncbi:hypothetical protein MIMGU_mgv11b018884mg [Erythranthe guttata]|uniref:starch synthase n=1 Tax=Erythranthe guttata TaxID=4155 RepID=A0A022RVJ6_ERYGU|nr:hypothetical protein MIMGU_mgv11b018884mg [Erythranthe guttata]
MEILMAASVPKPSLLPQISHRNQKCPRPLLLNCSRLGSPSSEVHQKNLKYIDDVKKEKPNDIWQLFKEAQQNIMYLNKQRLLAMEELDRVKNERNSLLDRVEQLEMKQNTNDRRGTLTISPELLLRIDSLVLNGVIGSTEASDLRRLVMDSRDSSTDDLNDLIYKSDAEFLAELRQFSNKSKKYALLNLSEVQGLREVESQFYSFFDGQLHGNRIWTGTVYGIGVTFIEPVYYSSFFSQDKVYGYSNDFERFTYFSRAALDYLVKTGKQPDVLHIHNWHTSIVGPLFWDVFVNQGFEGTRILLTCQGFGSQCLEQPEKLALCGLDPSSLFQPDRLQDNNKSHLVNILKAGVVYSNKVIIMSSLQTKGQIISALGHGLESTLTIHKEKLVISPCGIDKSTWDPSSDKFLPQSYSADDMKGKSLCKVALQHHLGLPEGAVKILVGCIYSSILDGELEKLKTLVWMASRREAQFILIGSSQNPGMKKAFELFQEEVKDENVKFIDAYDEQLSHLIIAGSDILLCPSFDDPLHQVPLKAIKYGTAPIAVDFADDSRFRHTGENNAGRTKFSQYINSTFANMSLVQAIDEIKNNPSQWNKRIKDAMEKDFSWDSECADVHVSAYASVKCL